MTDTMSPQAELSTTFQGSDSAAVESSERSVALIGPNETSRSIVARALASSDAGFVREFAAYPSKLIEVPRILEQNFSVVMIDVDSDEGCALALVEALAAAGTTTVMVYSTRNQPDLMMRCMQAGARDFLPLPSETPAEVKPAEPRLRRDTIHVVEPVGEAPVEAIAPAAPAPVAPVLPVTAIVEAPPLPRQIVSEPTVPKHAAAEPTAEPMRAVGAESVAATRAEITPPTFGVPKEELQPKRKVMVWLLAAVPVAALAIAGSIYLRHGHEAPAPAPIATEAQQVQPAATNNTIAPAAQPATETELAKPAAGMPAPQTAAPSAPQPQGVAPDAMNAQLTAPSRIGGDLKRPAQKEEAAPAGFAPGAMESGGGLPGGVFAQRAGVQVRAGSHGHLRRRGGRHADSQIRAGVSEDRPGRAG